MFRKRNLGAGEQPAIIGCFVTLYPAISIKITPSILTPKAHCAACLNLLYLSQVDLKPALFQLNNYHI